MALIIDGIFNGELPWSLVLIGALIAVVLELSGVPSLPFAVGVYLPITASVPIFSWAACDPLAGRPCGPRQIGRRSGSESSPGILLSSGYIAGGTLGGTVLGAMLAFLPTELVRSDPVESKHLPSQGWNESALAGAWWRLAVLLMLFLLLVGSGKMLSCRRRPKASREARETMHRQGRADGFR